MKSHYSPPRRWDKTGFSLIEAAIVLGVVGLVVGGIWVAATTIRQKIIINRLAEATLSITSGMTRVWGKGNMSYDPSLFGQNITAEMLAAGVFPKGFTENNDHAANGCWTGSTAAVPPDGTGTYICLVMSGGEYDINLTHMPLPVCMGVINKIQNSPLIRVIEMADSFSKNASNPIYRTPISLATLKDQCSLMDGDVRIAFAIQ